MLLLHVKYDSYFEFSVCTRVVNTLVFKKLYDCVALRGEITCVC